MIIIFNNIIIYTYEYMIINYFAAKNVKKFTLESINTLNPLFHNKSDRKLYEKAIGEVMTWHKTKPEDRKLPIWKKGDEDTQGSGGTSSNEGNFIF